MGGAVSKLSFTFTYQIMYHHNGEEECDEESKVKHPKTFYGESSALHVSLKS